jgi:hypothetical protein
MTESQMYAAALEKKLIEEFKEKFREKLGYRPVVLTRVEIGTTYVPVMTLDELISCFDPFLPEHFGRKLTLYARSRKREIVELRMMFCYLARSMKYNLGTIGEKLGGRDHTTVIHGVNTFVDLIETNEQFRNKFQEILNHIKQNHESPDLDEFNTSQRISEPALLS